mgnify:CR=1 FL=1|jgi:hypothetical protein|tara:strand:+ start:16793 stop:17995 length:1203 start_codon:yes stop_codon:yes gene_type:complete
MSFKRFKTGDIVHSTIVAKPEFNFSVNRGKVFLNYESYFTGSFSNNIKHIQQGHVSLYEINVNRPSDSLATQFISKDTTRYAFSTITDSAFDDSNQFTNGDRLTHPYPMTASVNRIYVPTGQEFDVNNFSDDPSFSPANKKYIRALKNVIESQSPLTKTEVKYGSLGTSNVNIIAIPAIFYGSEVAKETVELNFYVTGTLTSQAKDIYGNGELVSTYGIHSGSQIGMVLYNQGLLLLTGALAQNSTYQDKYFDASANSSPKWLSFGTGLEVIGTPVSHGTVDDSSYEIKLKGTNKIPTVTMLAHAEAKEFNYSSNPTFIDQNKSGSTEIVYGDMVEKPGTIKNIKDSGFVGHEARFENITYISKIGIYDEYKNLIAIATLANPVKKDKNKDYMFKLRLDF